MMSAAFASFEDGDMGSDSWLSDTNSVKIESDDLSEMESFGWMVEESDARIGGTSRSSDIDNMELVNPNDVIPNFSDDNVIYNVLEDKKPRSKGNGAPKKILAKSAATKPTAIFARSKPVAAATPRKVEIQNLPIIIANRSGDAAALSGKNVAEIKLKGVKITSPTKIMPYTHSERVIVTPTNNADSLLDSSSTLLARNNSKKADQAGKKGDRKVRAIYTQVDDPNSDKYVATPMYPKPGFSYSCLITMALKNSEGGCLPVAEIYNFMCDNFPYFKTAPTGWKNSVRHNLSLNKCFEKIEKPAGSVHRKGCLWTLNPARANKMEEEMKKWSKKDPATIKRCMDNPSRWELLESGSLNYIPGVKVCKFAETDEDTEEDTEEEALEDEDDLTDKIFSDDEKEVFLKKEPGEGCSTATADKKDNVEAPLEMLKVKEEENDIANGRDFDEFNIETIASMSHDFYSDFEMGNDDIGNIFMMGDQLELGDVGDLGLETLDSPFLFHGNGIGGTSLSEGWGVVNTTAADSEQQQPQQQVGSLPQFSSFVANNGVSGTSKAARVNASVGKSRRTGGNAKVKLQVAK